MVARRAGCASIVVAALTFAACSPGSASTPKPAQSQPSVLSGTIGKAAYSIEVPVGWNGTLFLYSHGYVAPGSANPAVAAPGSEATTWLVAHHYAIAGSSYSSTGWALEDALKDQVALLDLFDSRIAKPARVIYAIFMLDGDGNVASWNTGLDSAYAFRTLLAPGSALKLTAITDPVANLQVAQDAFNRARGTLAGDARLALVAALADLPGWFDPTKPQPGPADFKAQVAAQESWESRVDFAFEFKYRAELEKRAGGNPSWNTGVNYHHQLAISPDAVEVSALYRGAGLNLEADLRTLEAGRRIKADAAAVAYLDRNLSFDGRLSLPVLTMHTTGDGLVIP